MTKLEAEVWKEEYELLKSIEDKELLTRNLSKLTSSKTNWYSDLKESYRKILQIKPTRSNIVGRVFPPWINIIIILQFVIPSSDEVETIAQ